MFIFRVKDDGPDLQGILVRALLIMASIASLIIRVQQFFLINLLIALVFLTAAVFINQISFRYKIKGKVLFAGIALLLLIATHSFIFPVIVVIYGYLINKFLIRESTIEVSKNGVVINKLLSSPGYQWHEFENIVLKDNLLSLDFKNNKLIQVGVDDSRLVTGEQEFNSFCFQNIHA